MTHREMVKAVVLMTLAIASAMLIVAGVDALAGWAAR